MGGKEKAERYHPENFFFIVEGTDNDPGWMGLRKKGLLFLRRGTEMYRNGLAFLRH